MKEKKTNARVLACNGEHFNSISIAHFRGCMKTILLLLIAIFVKTVHPLGTNSFGYDGEYTDQHSYIYLRSREYNPLNIRFLSRDNRNSLNDYQFADDDPINKTDPYGHKAKRYLNGSLSVLPLSFLTFAGAFLPFKLMFYKSMALGFTGGVVTYLMENNQFSSIQNENIVDNLFKNFFVPFLATSAAYSSNNFIMLEMAKNAYAPLVGGLNSGLWGGLHSMIPELYDKKDVDLERFTGAILQTVITGMAAVKLGQVRLGALRGTPRNSLSLSRDHTWSRGNYYSGYRPQSSFSEDLNIPEISPNLKYTKSRNTITKILDLDEINLDIDHYLKRERLLERHSLAHRRVII